MIGLALPLCALALACAPTAQAKVVTKTFSSGNLNIPIAPGTFTALTKKVKVNGTIKDVDLSLRMSATNNNADFFQLLTLRSPAGVLIGLSGQHSGQGYGSGAASCSGTPTVFDDSAGGGFGDPGIVTPFAMRVRPDEQLAGLKGYPTKGRWDLQVAANVGNLGTRAVNCWALTIKYKAKAKKK
ncbi:MAG: hypothetical protein EXQ70_04700 [Solirubrobacterales bacterium]|nr:hypothetical protein [Solirubrobacterales bacterium]